MQKRDLESLRQYILKKGLGYFISNPSLEDMEAFDGLLFKNNFPILSNFLIICPEVF